MSNYPITRYPDDLQAYTICFSKPCCVFSYRERSRRLIRWLSRQPTRYAALTAISRSRSFVVISWSCHMTVWVLKLIVLSSCGYGAFFGYGYAIRWPVSWPLTIKVLAMWWNFMVLLFLPRLNTVWPSIYPFIGCGTLRCLKFMRSDDLDLWPLIY